MTIRITKIDGTDITNEIKAILTKFLKNVFKNLKSLTLDDLTPNPLLMKLVGEVAELHNPSEIVEYLISARIERSTSTGFGNTIQKIATAFGNTTGVEGADIEIVRDVNGNGVPVKWHIQLKSGPSTVNKDICLQTTRELQSAVRRAPGSAGLLGITYGKAEKVSSITHKYLAFDFKAGREFWEFISGDPDCYKKLWQITIEVAENYTDRSGKTLKQLIEEKREQLTKEFEEKYGVGGEEMWNNFLEHNM